MSKATITITSEKDGTVSISQVYEPSLSDGMTGTDHPAASVALHMLNLWTADNNRAASDEDKPRHVVIGPQGRAVLEKHLPAKTDQWVFRRAKGRRYDRQSYAGAIEKAATAAKVTVWTANQLRHSFATRVRLLHGASSVQDMLGHATLNQQQTYVDDVLARAKKLAREVG